MDFTEYENKYLRYPMTTVFDQVEFDKYETLHVLENADKQTLVEYLQRLLVNGYNDDTITLDEFSQANNVVKKILEQD